MSGPENQRTENCQTLQISLTEKCPATTIAVMLFHVMLRATRYGLVFRADLKIAADNSQQALFYLFIGTEIRIIQICQNGTVSF